MNGHFRSAPIISSRISPPNRITRASTTSGAPLRYMQVFVSLWANTSSSTPTMSTRTTPARARISGRITSGWLSISTFHWRRSETKIGPESCPGASIVPHCLQLTRCYSERRQRRPQQVHPSHQSHGLFDHQGRVRRQHWRPIERSKNVVQVAANPRKLRKEGEQKGEKQLAVFCHNLLLFSGLRRLRQDLANLAPRL